jgi:hypothetical protein
MLDPLAQQVGVGGALFLSALYIFLRYGKGWMKNGSGNNSKWRPVQSGELSPEQWEMKIAEIIRAQLEPLVEAIRNLKK